MRSKGPVLESGVFMASAGRGGDLTVVGRLFDLSADLRHAHRRCYPERPQEFGCENMLDVTLLKRVFPDVSSEVLQAVVDRSDALRRFEIDQSPNRLHFFFAQLGFESRGLRVRTRHEAGVSRLRSLLSPGQTAYGPRGFFAVAGKENYAQLGKRCRMPLVEHPELLDDAGACFVAACALWKGKGFNALSDTGDFRAVTRKIAGSTETIRQRKVWLGIVRANIPFPLDYVNHDSGSLDPVAPRQLPVYVNEDAWIDLRNEHEWANA